MKFLLPIIILDFIFDALSFLYGIARLLKKKNNISGFPVIGLVCYIVAIVGLYSYPIFQDVKLTGVPADILFTTPTHYIAIFLLILHAFTQAPLFVARKLQANNTNSD